jgi:hypothetical protein
MFANAEQK